MAKFLNGLHGPIIGKLGKTTSYLRKGQPIVRTLPLGKKVPFGQQTKQQISTGVVHELLRPMMDFLKIGYSYEARLHPTSSYYNRAFKMAKEAITGEHPSWKIDYSKVLVAKGTLPLPNNIEVQMVPEGLKFTWDTDKPERPGEGRDHAMVMAFHPESQIIHYIRSGNLRSSGEQILPTTITDSTMEIYISFISDDHLLVSNSQYLGQALRLGESV